MNEATNNGANFIGYEYKEVAVKRDMQSVYADGYPNFGWVLDGSTLADIGISIVNLKFKRDRKIRNKAELTRLQRQFESNAKEIEKLEQSKTATAITIAFAIGIVGTGFMAGSILAFMAQIIPLCVILAFPALIGWALPYFLFMKLTAKRTETVAPLIEQQYDAIYGVCEKAHGLLV